MPLPLSECHDTCFSEGAVVMVFLQHVGAGRHASRIELTRCRVVSRCFRDSADVLCREGRVTAADVELGQHVIVLRHLLAQSCPHISLAHGLYLVDAAYADDKVHNPRPAGEVPEDWFPEWRQNFGPLEIHHACTIVAEGSAEKRPMPELRLCAATSTEDERGFAGQTPSTLLIEVFIGVVHLHHLVIKDAGRKGTHGIMVESFKPSSTCHLLVTDCYITGPVTSAGVPGQMDDPTPSYIFKHCVMEDKVFAGRAGIVALGSLQVEHCSFVQWGGVCVICHGASCMITDSTFLTNNTAIIVERTVKLQRCKFDGNYDTHAFVKTGATLVVEDCELSYDRVRHRGWVVVRGGNVVGARSEDVTWM